MKRLICALVLGVAQAQHFLREETDASEHEEFIRKKMERPESGMNMFGNHEHIIKHDHENGLYEKHIRVKEDSHFSTDYQ